MPKIVCRVTISPQLSELLNDAKPVNTDLAEKTASTLQILSAVVPPDVQLFDDIPPQPDPPEDTGPEPPPDLTGVADTDIPVILALLNDIFKGFTSTATPGQLMGTTFCLLTKTQMDSGANTSLTNDLSLLHTRWDVPAFRLKGIGGGVVCTKRGLFHLHCTDGSVLPVLM